MKTFKEFMAEDDIDSYENRMTAGLGVSHTPYGGGRFGGSGGGGGIKTKVKSDSKPQITKAATKSTDYLSGGKSADLGSSILNKAKAVGRALNTPVTDIIK